MNIIFLLAPFSLLLALTGLGAFLWTLRNNQYDDPAGDAARILLDDPAEEGPPSKGGKIDAPTPGQSFRERW